MFNKLSRRNAVSLDTWLAVLEIVDRFEVDPSVRIVVLKGAAACFECQHFIERRRAFMKYRRPAFCGVEGCTYQFIYKLINYIKIRIPSPALVKRS